MTNYRSLKSWMAAAVIVFSSLVSTSVPASASPIPQGLKDAFESLSRDKKSSNQSRQEDGKSLSPKQVYQKLIKATVWIHRKNGSHGTGWILDKDRGLIITNHHVVSTDKEVKLFVPKYDEDGTLITDAEEYTKYTRPIKGSVIDSEIGKDLALIQVKGKLPSRMGELELASKSASPADRVHAVGGKPEKSQGVFGYVNGYVRQVAKGKHSQPGTIWIIQTSLPINRGNSGGAIVNDQGQLVGVNSTGYNNVRNVTGGTDVRELKKYLKTINSLYPASTFKQLLAVGRRHLDARRYDESIRYLTAAIEREPGNSSAYRLRGYSFNLKGESKSAIQDFDVAVKKNASDWDAYRGRALAYKALKNYKQAHTDISKAIQLHPTSKYAFYNRGTILISMYRYEEAVQDFRQALKLDPNYEPALTERGYAYLRLKLFTRATADLEKSIKLRPTFTSLNNLGVAYKELGKLELAWKAYSLATKYNSKNHLAWQGMSEILVRQKNYTSAISYANRTLEIFPRSVRAMNVLAISHFQKGEQQLSLKEINKAIKLSPKFAMLYETRWNILNKLGYQQKAQQDLDMLVKLDPKTYGTKQKRVVAKPKLSTTGAGHNQNHFTGIWRQQGTLNGVKYRAAIKFTGNSYIYFVDWTDVAGKSVKTDGKGTYTIGKKFLTLTSNGGRTTKHSYGFDSRGNLVFEFPHVNISEFFVMKRAQK